MAGTLTEGVQYGLSSNGLPSENKSLVFVKLTDSSFKAIEEYLRIKVRSFCLLCQIHDRRDFPSKAKKKLYQNSLRRRQPVAISSVCVCVCPQGTLFSSLF